MRCPFERSAIFTLRLCNSEEEIGKEKKRKMSSVCEKKHDAIIQRFVDEATGKLNKCEKKLKEMEVMVTSNQENNQTQKRTFTSMLMAMASNIREQARKLRSQQQSQLHRQRQLRQYDKNILQGDSSTMATQSQTWFSQQDFEMLQQNMAKERDAQINKIVQSIYSLNGIYKELQSLVIQQGSLLDRIDQHIDHTVQNVKKANKHLQQANKKAQSSCFTKLRLCLIIAIAAFFIILILKHS